MQPFPRTWIDIRLPALAHNLGLVRTHVGPGVQIALVAKADAYGHGLVPVARYAACNGADWICVATVQEGIALRDAGLELPILVLSPILEIEAEQAVFYDLRIAVESDLVPRALGAAAVRQNKIALVHFEVDTGLSRFGASPEAALQVLREILKIEGVEVEGICHHYVDSGNNSARTCTQIAKFDQFLSHAKQEGIHSKLIHSSNSAGAMHFSQPEHNLVRIGILAYGIDPYNLSESAEPMLEWRARITAIRDIKAGDTVGYSESYTAKSDARIATLGVGYGDGLSRNLSNRGHVFLNGHEAPIVGLVCMDQTMIDVTGIEGVGIGGEVELISTRMPVTRIAKEAGTNCHEITTRIMSRVPRRYTYI